MIRWGNWSLHLVLSKFEDLKGKGYAHTLFFLLLDLCTPMVEAKESDTSRSRKRQFLLQISGMGFMEYTQEKQCFFLQSRSPSTHQDVATTLWFRGCKILNMPEFMWCISCAIVSDHYLFHCFDIIWLFTSGMGSDVSRYTLRWEGGVLTN